MGCVMKYLDAAGIRLGDFMADHLERQVKLLWRAPFGSMLYAGLPHACGYEADPVILP